VPTTGSFSLSFGSVCRADSSAIVRNWMFPTVAARPEVSIVRRRTGVVGDGGLPLSSIFEPFLRSDGPQVDDDAVLCSALTGKQLVATVST
jgi:hypothetical protein